MKKLMTLALAAMFAASAFAQNPDALKQIKKCKTFAEAQTLVKQNESSMTAAENAQAYNKLVDLAYGKASEAQATIQTNQAMEQMGQKGQPVDMKAFYADLYNALDAALTCDKYDIQPNDKGKVAPKFRKSNCDRLLLMRTNLINGGQDAQNQEPSDTETAAKYYGMYAKTGVADLFKDGIAAQAKNNPKGVGDEYLGEVARVAAICAFQTKDLASAEQYADIVMQDPEKAKEGLQLKMYLIEQQAKTHEDSLNCVKQLEDIYAQNPTSGDAFAQLAQWYNNLNMMDKQSQLIDQRLQSDPTNFTALAMKGQNYMNVQKYDEAIECYKKATESQVEDEKQKALVLTYIGFCYNQKAANAANGVEQNKFYEAAIPYLEQAKQIDPERERANWAYPLYQCYYGLYGENDARTQEVKTTLGY